MTTRISEVRMIEPASNQVRVMLEGCGICASNLPVWEGREWFKYPLEAGSPGHEGWGIVDAVGPGVDDLEVGQRVALMSGHAYAEYDIATRGCVVPLPEKLDGEPFPGEPFGCVMNIFERSDIHDGQTVAVVGGGFIGLMLTQLAADAGAHVVVLSHREWALQLALTMEAEDVIATKGDGRDADRALQLTSNRGFDRVIEVSGVQSGLDLASDIVAERARLIIAGYRQDGPRLVNMQQWNWRGLDVINAHERSMERYVEGVQKAVQGRAGELEDLAYAEFIQANGAIVRLCCSWYAHIGQPAQIQMEVTGTRGGASWCNVDGSFYDFDVHLFHGTEREQLGASRDDWGTRALRAWLGQLQASNRFDAEAENIVRSAALIEEVYRA